MSHLTERVSRDLHQIAERATPSSTAWESIHARLGEQVDEPDMEFIMLAPNDNTKHGRKRTWIIAGTAAAAAALILVVVGGLTLLPADDDADVVEGPVPSESVDPAPITTDGLLAERVASVELMADAYSTGRMEEYLNYFAPDAQPFGTPLGEHRLVAEAFMAADVEWAIDNCRTRSSGDDAIVCDSVTRDQFHGAGGVEVVGEMTFYFDADGLVSRYVGSGDLDVYRVFGAAFNEWLQLAHPDVAADYGPFLYEGGVLSQMPTAADMPIALEYVDEFVAQSDEYPIDG